MAETRRGALKRALLLLGGLAGLAVSKEAVAAGTESGLQGGSETITLHGRHWHIFSRDLSKGELPSSGQRMLAYGDLHYTQEGEKAGEFFATYVSLHRPGWSGPLTSIEQHTFVLPEGSIMGSGTTNPGLESQDEFAIVGGTGRYAGARGTYVLKQSHQEFGGDGTASVTFKLVSEGDTRGD